MIYVIDDLVCIGQNVGSIDNMIKVFERVLRQKMVNFMDRNNILCNNQHGFRSGHSCLTQMLSHFDDIMLGLIRGNDTDSIYLDYAKAFDKVDHKLLLEKLRIYGFHSQLIKWISSFLEDRTQTVIVNGKQSKVAKVISGVPQGTVLGPILFILFINDIETCIKHSKVHLFADDTRIRKEITCMGDVAKLQEDLFNVSIWTLENNMVLNEDKLDLIVHRANPATELDELPHRIEAYTYKTLSGITLYPSNSVRDLGIAVSPDLTWRAHISAIVSQARPVASWVLSVFRARDRYTMLTLYKSIVRSHLENCCPLWNPSQIGDIQLLESVQRTFTSRIKGVQHMNYWTRLSSLNLMSLQRRRERYIILQVHKILHGLCPNDVRLQFSPPSRLGIRAIVPKLSRSAKQVHQTLYDNSFGVLGPRLWNTIPAELTLMVDKFKDNLTDYLLTVPDKPPVQGYSCANTNSILSWNENRAESQLLRWSPQGTTC